MRTFILFFQGQKKIPQEKLDRIGEVMESWFMFSLIWSVGITGDSDGRLQFSKYLRDKMISEKVMLCDMYPPVDPQKSNTGKGVSSVRS